MKKLKTFFLSCFLLMMYSCQEADFFGIQLEESHKVTSLEHYISELPKVVCDPMTETNQGNDYDSNRGVKGRLFEGLVTISQFSDLVDPEAKQAIDGQSLQADAEIYMRMISVPTRAFSEGFKLGEDRYVIGSQDQILTEDFGMQLNTRLALGDLDEGYYEFALLADDGSVMRIQTEGHTFEEYDHTLISADFTTSTRMNCSDYAVRMTSNTLMPVEFDYFQGPRYHIALTLLARKVADIDPGHNSILIDNPLRDQECGHRGNSRYFNSNNNSVPTDNFLGLLDRGWFIFPEHNFFLPQDSDINYCLEGTNIVLDREQCFREDIYNLDLGEYDLSLLSAVDQIDPSTLQIWVNETFIEEEAFTFSEEDEVVRFTVSPAEGQANLRVTYCLKEGS